MIPALVTSTWIFNLFFWWHDSALWCWWKSGKGRSLISGRRRPGRFPLIQNKLKGHKSPPSFQELNASAPALLSFKAFLPQPNPGASGLLGIVACRDIAESAVHISPMMSKPHSSSLFASYLVVRVCCNSEATLLSRVELHLSNRVLM